MKRNCPICNLGQPSLLRDPNPWAEGKEKQEVPFKGEHPSGTGLQHSSHSSLCSRHGPAVRVGAVLSEVTVETGNEA